MILKRQKDILFQVTFMIIKFVLFDLGGVLTSKGLETFSKKIAKIEGVGEEVIKEKMKKLETDLRLGNITLDRYLKSIFPQQNLSTGDIATSWFDCYELRQNVFEFAVMLKRFYNVGIQSNNFKERFDYIDNKFGFTKNFNFIFLSYTIKSTKPSIEFYQKILNILDCRPNEILIIDDKERNVNAATSIGLNGHIFTSLDDLKNILKIN